MVWKGVSKQTFYKRNSTNTGNRTQMDKLWTSQELHGKLFRGRILTAEISKIASHFSLHKTYATSNTYPSFVSLFVMWSFIYTWFFIPNYGWFLTSNCQQKIKPNCLITCIWYFFIPPLHMTIIFGYDIKEIKIC